MGLTLRDKLGPLFARLGELSIIESDLNDSLAQVRAEATQIRAQVANLREAAQKETANVRMAQETLETAR